MSNISKEDFLQVLDQSSSLDSIPVLNSNLANNTNTKESTNFASTNVDLQLSAEAGRTPISGQIFFGTDFTEKLVSNLTSNNDTIGYVTSPNTPLSLVQINNSNDFYADAKNAFDNPCFEKEAKKEAKLQICTKKNLNSSSSTHNNHQPKSPTKLATDVPVVAPKARRASSVFPTYLRRSDSLAMQNNIQNKFKSQDSTQLMAPDCMTAQSTRFLEPYNGINLDTEPRIENYTKFDNNNLIQLNCTIGNELRSTNFEPPNYEENKQSQTTGISSVKFGWFEGVFIRTSVNLLGVMLFMRMGWMSGQAGIFIALLQIAIATVITCLTTLSMNALCTNGDIGAGGIYSMISRSLGPEAGANIGIIFAFTNAAFVGLNVIGAADAVIQIFKYFEIRIFYNQIDDIRLVGFLFLIIIALIPIISLQLEAKTQTFFLGLIVICILDYFIGTIIPPNYQQKVRGFHGWHTYVAVGNLWPKWVGGENFFTVFAVFFPSVTPIFTGACMSGDLKKPAKAIPKGTFWSIAVTSITYALFIIITGCTIVSFAIGDGSDFGINNQTFCPPSKCKYGLINDYNTVSLSSAMSHLGFLEIEPFIYIGILAATLSSALGCYMAAPRIFQSFAEDKLLPYISWFAKGYGPANDPRRGYLLTLLIAAIFTGLGDLNLIAPYISNFYLASFFLVNVTCFHAAWVNTPSFRPSFRYFNKWVSLLTGLKCFILMFLLDYVSAFLSVFLMAFIFFFIKKWSPRVNWGTTSEAQLFNLAHSSALKWDLTSDHVKNYRPRIVCLTGNPSARSSLLDMAFAITRDYGLLFAFHLKQGKITAEQRIRAESSQKLWLYNRKVRAFYALAEAQSLSEGVKKIVPVMGLGKLKPNIVMLGYKSNWQECTENDLKDYFQTIVTTHEMRCTLIVFRIQEGFDFSEYLNLTEEQYNEDNKRLINAITSMNKMVDGRENYGSEIDKTAILNMIEETNETSSTIKSMKDFIKRESNNHSSNASVSSGLYKSLKSKSNAHSLNSIHTKLHRNNINNFLERNVTNEIPKVIFRSMNQFQVLQKPGTIDVWWIYDTGGICILIAYILRNNHLWRNSKIRVFSVIRNAIDIESMKMNLIDLLQKFRIPFSDVKVLTDDVPPLDETKLQFRDVINDWIADEETEKNCQEEEIRMKISKSELINHRDLTNRHIRLRELLLEYSYEATLVLMSMPRPSKGDISAPLYMAWLEMLTQNMPPFLLIRGSQSVLTFYC